MELITGIVCIVLGLLAGFLLGMRIRRSGLEAKSALEIREAEGRAGLLSQQLTDRQLEAEQFRTKSEELGRQLAALEATAYEESRRLEELRGGLEKITDELHGEQNRRTMLTLELERRNTEFRELEKKVQQREKDFLELQEQFREQFENLANKIFEEKSKNISENNKVQLEGVLNPLKERINNFERQIRDSNVKTAEARTALKEQIKQLTTLNNQMLEDARNLTHALKGDSKIQGNWGEMILEKVLEKSGLIKGREYHVQQRMITDSGRRLQPDVVVDLPEEKKVVIDSKVSLKAYERYISAETDEERQVHCKNHLNSIRAHIKGLAGKNYPEIYGIKSPDFVLMFIPIEPAFTLALREDEQLYMRAFEYNIVIVTPSTLLATLSTVSSLWRQEYQNRNVLAIAKQAGSLYDKFFGFYNDLKVLGGNLGKAQKTYDQALNKLISGNGNLVSQVEKIKLLGARTKKQLPKELLDQAAEDGQLPFD